tara:strand:- start:68 stop:313 length:246 start_codon:yes stop_codon:yes gene_type:complete
VSTTNEPLNTSAIQNFIQMVKSAEGSNAKEVRLTMPQAKNLAFTLGITMARLHGDLEKFVKDSKSNNDEVIEVNMDMGGKW